MGCPRCQCNEISASGMCLWCGYQVNALSTEPEPGRNNIDAVTGKAEMGSSHTPDEPGREELPQWRQELSKRLQSIKRKREASRAQPRQAVQTASVAAAAPGPDGSTATEKTGLPMRARAAARVSRRRTVPIQEKLTEAPAQPQQKEFPEPELPSPVPPQNAVQENEYNAAEIMDTVISQPPADPAAPAKSAATTLITEGPSFLVHRFFSGLLDMMILLASMAALIVAVDFFSGIRMPEFKNILHYSLLFLLVYFVYSLLFLGFSNQTIGMMMMNLHVLGRDDKRPRLGPMLARSCLYLVSVFCLGFGLLWAIFDPERQCFHDRLTGTRVSRQSPVASRQ